MWEITNAHGEGLEGLLREGWEPFAIGKEHTSCQQGGPWVTYQDVWLKRTLKERDDHTGRD